MSITELKEFFNMKKIIDIPNEILQELKILAVKSNKDLKNFIQDELRKLVESSQSKPS
jgi:hypothetical protein